ncbi:hypothetical protein V1264_009752 [Littorina saxatilis]|uniref:Uncharacterized protein n=2 Tax=Littorina saxatilis TaxID=31220 RepID=A0AAN9ASC4_9CAEN
MPFRDFKTGGDDVKECRHHPGYVTKDQWTCCQQKCDSGHPSHKEHAQKGCTVSRHSWRPHKKAARGKRVAMNGISDNVLQHRPARRALKMMSLAY